MKNKCILHNDLKSADWIGRAEFNSLKLKERQDIYTVFSLLWDIVASVKKMKVTTFIEYTERMGLYMNKQQELN